MSTASPTTQKRKAFTPQTFARGIAIAFMLAFGVGILTFAMTSENAANRDFISYWAVGQQLVHRANPYDGPEILHIEQAAGSHDNRPFFMRNAPPAFFMALPLGFVGPRIGAVLWSLLIIANLMISIRLLRVIYGSPQNDLHLVGYVFPPVLACILAGQTGIFVLLGVVLFLRFYDTRPASAGASLLLCSLKPHLLLPFGVALLAWMLTEKRYRLLSFAVGSFLASCVLAFLLDPHGWQQYSAMMRAAKLDGEFTPTLSLIFRLAIDPKFSWLQFVPALLGCYWALRYFWKHRAKWAWAQHGQLLLLVSIAVAPYAWFTDQAIVLPAFMGSLYLRDQSGRSLLPLLVLSGIALIEVLAGIMPNSPLYLWTSLAWFVVYFSASQARKINGLTQCANP